MPATLYESRINHCWDCKEARKSPELLGKEELVIVQCKLCNCIMNAKARLPNATCPIGKF